MIEKDYHLYGIKVLNLKTQEIGLLICTWKNRFADAEIDCLGFLPRSQSFAFGAVLQPAQSVRYPVVAVQKSALLLVLIGKVKDTILNLII